MDDWERRRSLEIDMEKVESIFKDAIEIATSCEANVGIIICSPADEPYSFFSPNEECVIDRFLNRTRPPLDSTADARAKIDQLTKEIEELEIKRKAEEERAKKLDELGATESGDMSSWLGKPFEELSRDEILHLKSRIENFRDQLVAHSEELKRRGDEA